MKSFQILTLVAALSLPTSAARAQFGLYGSPGMVAIPSVQAQPPAVAPRFFRPGAPDASPLRQVAALQPALPPASDAPRPPGPEGNAPSVVDQMLSEANRPLPPPWGNNSACGPDTGCRVDEVLGCGDVEGCAPCFQPNWYALARGLIMTRDEANRLWTTYESGNNPNQLPTDAGWDWRGGGEIRFGRYFACGTWALEAAYWTLDPFTDMASQTHANGVATTLDFTDVVWRNGGIPGLPVDLFDGAAEHRVWRRAEVHNVEVNLIHNRVGFDRRGPLDLDWSVGVRYLRFDEDLTFGSRDAGTTDWTSDLTAVGFLDDDIRNNLVGGQFGCDLNYSVDNWRLFVTPRVGVYGNHIRHRFAAYRGDGQRFDVVPAGYPSYPVSSTKNVVSFLTEIDVGLSWQFATRWSAEIGYRLVVATGIGLTDHQIPPFVVDTPELADIDHNGTLVLHGGIAGLTYRF